MTRSQSLAARLAYRLVARAPAAGRARTAGRLAPVFEAVFVAAGSPLFGQTVRVAHGPGAGLRLHAERRSLVWISGRVEEAVQTAIVAFLPTGGCFIDIGASIGLFSLLAARVVGPTGVVVSFEPQPEAAASLRQNVELNAFETVTVVEAAVSSREGDVLLEGAGKATAHVVGDDRGSRRALRVACTSLDGFLADHRDVQPHVLKIDVEGHESEALEGMQETLLVRRPVLVIECHGDAGAFLSHLQTARYDVSVLGSDVSPFEAPASAHLLALPEERRHRGVPA